MRILWLAILLFIVAAFGLTYRVTRAHAQTITAGTQTCFPRVAGLAKKLAVPPNDPNNAPSILIAACNGKTYDLLHLIDALLNKMEKAAK